MSAEIVERNMREKTRQVPDEDLLEAYKNARGADREFFKQWILHRMSR